MASIAFLLIKGLPQKDYMVNSLFVGFFLFFGGGLPLKLEA